jgi:hypothetical protein
MKSKAAIIPAVAILLFCACSQESAYEPGQPDPAWLHRGVKQLTEVIVHDIFSPPVASRIYSYASVAAYETVIQGNTDASQYSLAGKLNELTPVPPPPDPQTWDAGLASMHAFLTVGKALIFSEEKIEAFEQELYAGIRERTGMPQSIYDNSLAYGKQVADHVLTWSANDNYKQTRTFPKYSITNDPSKWQPTPPAYMDGIEPSWSMIRPFVLDSSSQFAPMPPTPFSVDKDSRFYIEAMEVYTVNDPANPDYAENKAIADFWDCNPYVSHQRGHMMFATKKITPGGHWMGITGQVSRQQKLNFIETARAYALVAVTLCDGFVSCWDEKYRSILVRPETYINKYIDPDWVPGLQTPPFPEHTSGHSVISSAAGEVLTALLGDNIAFADSVELEYGLPVRVFSSFREAYQEAAISRMYGGIHYRPAIEYGVDQGKKVGDWIISRLINTETPEEHAPAAPEIQQ